MDGIGKKRKEIFLNFLVWTIIKREKRRNEEKLYFPYPQNEPKTFPPNLVGVGDGEKARLFV